MPDTPATSELAIPAPAIGNAGAVEILRAWIVDGSLHLTLEPAFPTPETWGLLLADVAREAARGFAGEDGSGATEALARIEWALEAELETPTIRQTDDKPAAKQ